ncbi:hypothetical protein SUGI_0636620 [Cryptomeria japonica]|nr:hypothetical protein SUGI_0636620 [Cryptomeria japonica]
MSVFGFVQSCFKLPAANDVFPEEEGKHDENAKKMKDSKLESGSYAEKLLGGSPAKMGKASESLSPSATYVISGIKLRFQMC